MIDQVLKQSTAMLIVAALFTVSMNVTADEAEREAQPPPQIVIDAPPPTKSPVKHESVETETVTIYESKVLPGFRPCTTKDYQNSDIDPVACEDLEEARVISTREADSVSQDLIVEDDAVPQGNIFKLKFERFKRKKAQ